MAEGKDRGTHQVEDLAFYQSLQPEVAQASASADETIMAYIEAEPDGITEEPRDTASGSPEQGCAGAPSNAG